MINNDNNLRNLLNAMYPYRMNHCNLNAEKEQTNKSKFIRFNNEFVNELNEMAYT